MGGLIRFGGIDPVRDVGFGVPETCDHCCKPIEALEHPRFHAGRTTVLQGKQWTCECRTWGPVG